jgi:hypothetical protein
VVALKLVFQKCSEAANEFFFVTNEFSTVTNGFSEVLFAIARKIIGVGYHIPTPTWVAGAIACNLL